MERMDDDNGGIDEQVKQRKCLTFQSNNILSQALKITVEE